jgi:hypothetical protein
MLAVLVAALAATCLAGCDTFLPDPVAFTMIDAQPVVRLCLPLTVTSVQVKTYSSENDYEGSIVWSSSGWHFFPAGSEFVIGEGQDGLAVTQDAGADFLTGDFAVMIAVTSNPGGSWTTFSRIDRDEFAEGSWLDGYGEPIDTPCTRGECMPMSACYNEWPIPTGYPTEPESTFVPPEPTPAVTGG